MRVRNRLAYIKVLLTDHNCPENIPKLAWNNLPLELIMFYHDGKLVPKEIQLTKMKELMIAD